MSTVWVTPARRGVVVAVGVTVLLGFAACSRGGGGTDSRLGTARLAAAIDPKTGTSASPRLANDGEAIPKGGGSFKLGSPYKISGRWYVPREDHGYDATGVASWYGTDFHGRKTANGEIYDMNALTAAHTTLPLPSYVYVTNVENGRTVLVRVNDRGPYAHDRIIDLSRQTARALGSEGQGLANVRVRYAGRAPLDGNDNRERRHLAAQPWWRGGAPDMIAAAPRRDERQPDRFQQPAPQQTSSGGWSPFAHRAGRSSLGSP